MSWQPSQPVPGKHACGIWDAWTPFRAVSKEGALQSPKVSNIGPDWGEWIYNNHLANTVLQVAYHQETCTLDSPGSSRMHKYRHPSSEDHRFPHPVWKFWGFYKEHVPFLLGNNATAELFLWQAAYSKYAHWTSQREVWHHLEAEDCTPSNLPCQFFRMTRHMCMQMSWSFSGRVNRTWKSVCRGARQRRCDCEVPGRLPQSRLGKSPPGMPEITFSHPLR